MRFLLALLLLCGCDADVDPLAVEDVFELGANPMVDVLFVIDDSNSMAEIQAGVAASWPAFALGLGTADWQVGVTTTDFDAPGARGRLRWVTPQDRVLDPLDASPDLLFSGAVNAGIEGSQIERGLQAAWAAVTSPLASHENAGLVREEARLAVVLVSDEDDCSDEGALEDGIATDCQTLPELLVPVTELVRRFVELKPGLGDVTLHAVVETGDLETGCGLPNPGTRYVQAAGRTGGRVMPPCGDFAATMTMLGAEISGLRRAYPLSRTADVSSIVVGTESLTAGAASLSEDITGLTGWTYDAEGNALLLGSDVVLSDDTVVRIAYTVPTS